MSIRTQAMQYGRGRLTRKLSRSMPWIGGLLALAALGVAMRRKGFFRGALDTALDVTPVVGGLKNLAEAARGRDFLRDRSGSAPNGVGSGSDRGRSATRPRSDPDPTPFRP